MSARILCGIYRIRNLLNAARYGRRMEASEAVDEGSTNARRTG